MKEDKIISLLAGGIHLPPKLCQMTFKAFNGVFESLIKDPKFTYEQAYDLMEKAHKKIFEKRRYSSYQSFRQVRKRQINK